MILLRVTKTGPITLNNKKLNSQPTPYAQKFECTNEANPTDFNCHPSAIITTCSAVSNSCLAKNNGEHYYVGIREKMPPCHHISNCLANQPTDRPARHSAARPRTTAHNLSSRPFIKRFYTRNKWNHAESERKQRTTHTYLIINVLWTLRPTPGADKSAIMKFEKSKHYTTGIEAQPRSIGTLRDDPIETTHTCKRYIKLFTSRSQSNSKLHCSSCNAVTSRKPH